MAAPLVGVSPLFAVFFLGCSIGKRLQQTETNEKLKFVQFIERIISRIHRTHQYALAGGLAGVFTTVIMVPGERIKCLLQVCVRATGLRTLCGYAQVQSHATGPPKYSGPMDVTRQLWKEGGIRSIYKGTFVTLARGTRSSDNHPISSQTSRRRLRIWPVTSILWTPWPVRMPTARN
jgi:solute carrier family 25 carnitine/acylcarnitine transporter 20/29